MFKLETKRARCKAPCTKPLASEEMACPPWKLCSRTSKHYLQNGAMVANRRYDCSLLVKPKIERNSSALNTVALIDSITREDVYCEDVL